MNQSSHQFLAVEVSIELHLWFLLHHGLCRSRGTPGMQRSQKCPKKKMTHESADGKLVVRVGALGSLGFFSYERDFYLRGTPIRIPNH